METVNNYICLFTFSFMTIANIFVFVTYRGQKYDKPSLFVLISYNLSYLIECILSMMELANNFENHRERR